MIQQAAPTVKISDPGRIPLHLVVRGAIELGRDCNGLLLTDGELSRRHLLVSAAGTRVTVQDLGSTNGTRLDGSALDGPVTLAVGQVVEFGRCRLELEPIGSAPIDGRAQPVDAAARTSIDLVLAAATADPVPASSVLAGGGTITIVFSDIEQSIRRSEQLGDEAWLRLLAFHNTLVRRHVARRGGVEVKAEGDGFMVAFPNARSAVLCSIEIMRALDAHARSHPPDAMRVRIGMHTGEAVPEDGDLFGTPVALAAQIANQAGGGEILVSSLVREIVESRGDLAFGAIRESALKGLRRSYALHSVAWTDRR